MKKRILLILLTILGIIGITRLIWGLRKSDWSLLSPLGKVEEEKKELPLVKYEFERLRNREPVVSEIILDRVLNQSEDFASHLFFYESEGYKISGLANLPEGQK